MDKLNRFTRAQIESLRDLYKANPDGTHSFLAFRRRARMIRIASDRYAGLSWAGMFVGIELDGYRHT